MITPEKLREWEELAQRATPSRDSARRNLRHRAGPPASKRVVLRCGCDVPRSAKQAGFFAHGEDRLVKPSGTSAPTTKPVETPQARPTQFAGGGDGKPPLDPLLQAIIDKLPPSGSEWSTEDMVVWLGVFAGNMRFVYKGVGGVKIEAGG